MRTVICEKCGAEVSDQYSFCAKCGTVISEKARRVDEPKLKHVDLSERAFTPLETRETKQEPRILRVQKQGSRSGVVQGAIVGAFIGFLYGVVATVIYYVVWLPFMMKLFHLIVTSNLHFVTNPNLPETINMLTNILDYIGSVIILLTTVLGCVLGMIFVVLRERIPGRTTIRKAVLFSLVLIVLETIHSVLQYLSSYSTSPDYARLMNNPQVSGLLRTEFASLTIPLIIVSVASQLSLGFLFGYLLDRELKTKETELAPTSSSLERG